MCSAVAAVEIFATLNEMEAKVRLPERRKGMLDLPRAEINLLKRGLVRRPEMLVISQQHVHYQSLPEELRARDDIRLEEK